MRYIKSILLNNEDILLEAKVHPAVLIGGLTGIVFAALIALYYPQWIGKTGGFMKLFYKLQDWISLPLYNALYPYKLHDGHFFALIVLLIGLFYFMRAMLHILFTEFVISDQRIIAKTGIFTTTCIELDRNRVAGAIVYQDINGRMFDYGTIFIQGFSGVMVNIPAISSPYKVQRFLHARGHG
jgi:uncharacterized membrane protein YdbT with pleckstrin-like domain